jgi:predicted hydrocarbon binding protein
MVRELYLFFGDENVHLVWLELLITDADAKAGISNFLAEHNLDVRFECLVTMEQSQIKYGLYFNVDEISDIEKLVNELRTFDTVIDLKWGISKNASFQSYDFPLTFMGERAIITRATTFVDILKIIHEYTTQSNSLLFLSGLKGGKNAAKYFSTATKLEKDNLISTISNLFLEAGWGKLEIDFDFDTLKGQIKVIDSFIADTFKKTELPICSYISGYFSGFFSQVLGVNMYASETLCKSTGNPYCEHSINQAPDGNIEHLIRGEMT